MWEFLVRLFNSKILRLMFRVIAGVASAVFVISGFLFWQNQQKTKPDDGELEDQEDSDPPKRDNVRHLHRK